MAVDYKKNILIIKKMLENSHNPNICTIRKDFFDAEYAFLVPRIKNKNVLVAGSGLGHDTFFLSEYCKHITGIELIKTFVDESNRLLKIKQQSNISFIHGNFLHLPYEDKLFDIAILNMGTIGNFDEKKPVIESLYRVAKTVYFGFWEPNTADLQLRLKMYQEESNIRECDFSINGTTIRENISGLESNCTSKEELQNIIHTMNASITFTPIFSSFIMAEVY